MADSRHAVPGSEPTKAKRAKTMVCEADRASDYLAGSQPGRLIMHILGFIPDNRGGQGILPMHAHDIACDVADNGTSERRYNPVRVVKVPDAEKALWRNANAKKKRKNPLLPQISDEFMEYACLKCTHFVAAHKLIAEGNRTKMNLPGAQVLKLRPDDNEGKVIQKLGFHVIVYGEGLWYDKAALLALMREDNANVDVAKPETEVDAFGVVHQTVTALITAAAGAESTHISQIDVMSKIGDIGYDNLSYAAWEDLVGFRLPLSTPIASMLLDTLFHVCNGRVRSNVDNYAKINALHPTKIPMGQSISLDGVILCNLS